MVNARSPLQIWREVTVNMLHASMNARAFLVGCQRSGTTLLQVLMANHPDIYSFPETFFFKDTIYQSQVEDHGREPVGIYRLSLESRLLLTSQSIVGRDTIT